MTKPKPKLLMTCGIQDYLYKDNIKLKNHLEQYKFAYTYLEWDGEHLWDFWDVSIQVALEFFFGIPESGKKVLLPNGKPAL